MDGGRLKLFFGNLTNRLQTDDTQPFLSAHDTRVCHSCDALTDRFQRNFPQFTTGYSHLKGICFIKCHDLSKDIFASIYSKKVHLSHVATWFMSEWICRWFYYLTVPRPKRGKEKCVSVFMSRALFVFVRHHYK